MPHCRLKQAKAFFFTVLPLLHCFACNLLHPVLHKTQASAVTSPTRHRGRLYSDALHSLQEQLALTTSLLSPSPEQSS